MIHQARLAAELRSATCGNAVTLTCADWLACHRSNWPCILSQKSGDVPRADESRRDISAVILEWPFKMRERWARVMASREAASVMVISPRYSRRTSPGWAGLKIMVPPNSMVVLVVEQEYILILEPEREPPVAIDSNSPMVLQVSAQRMQMIARSIHVGGLGCDIQGGKQPA